MVNNVPFTLVLILETPVCALIVLEITCALQGEIVLFLWECVHDSRNHDNG